MLILNMVLNFTFVCNPKNLQVWQSKKLTYSCFHPSLDGCRFFIYVHLCQWWARPLGHLANPTTSRNFSSITSRSTFAQPAVASRSLSKLSRGHRAATTARLKSQRSENWEMILVTRCIYFAMFDCMNSSVLTVFELNWLRLWVRVLPVLLKLHLLLADAARYAST